MQRVARFSIANAKPVLLATAAIILACSAGMAWLHVDTNHINFFAEAHPLRQSAVVIDEELSGIYSFNVLLEGAPDSMNTPDAMRRMEELRVRLQAGASAAKGGGDGVVQSEGAASHQHPGLLEQPGGDAPGQHIGRRDADKAVRMQPPRNPQVAARVERHRSRCDSWRRQRPGRVEQAAAALELDATLGVGAHQRRNRQRRVRPALEADDGRLVADKAVAGDPRRDVAGVLGRERAEVRQKPGRRAKGRRARGPVERAGELADPGLAALLERKHLRQHRPVLAHRAHQRLVILPGIGKDDVENLLAHPLRRELLDQPGLGGARPGPGAELAQAALVDVDNDQPALVAVVGCQAPDQVAGALLQTRQRSAGGKVQQRPEQRSQGQA